ncbi:hypothetical protein KSP40_PGU012433 [Platanthera guangdongensis]|uniref:Uncharacterized protein n=1 Tax=Platanthera guangdongensis TaxID=2320717 RepID=A0ABR2MCX7_9ASPA
MGSSVHKASLHNEGLGNGEGSHHKGQQWHDGPPRGEHQSREGVDSSGVMVGERRFGGSTEQRLFCMVIVKRFGGRVQREGKGSLEVGVGCWTVDVRKVVGGELKMFKFLKGQSRAYKQYDKDDEKEIKKVLLLCHYCGAEEQETLRDLEACECLAQLIPVTWVALLRLRIFVDWGWRDLARYEGLDLWADQHSPFAADEYTIAQALTRGITDTCSGGLLLHTPTVKNFTRAQWWWSPPPLTHNTSSGKYRHLRPRIM